MHPDMQINIEHVPFARSGSFMTFSEVADDTENDSCWERPQQSGEMPLQSPAETA